MSNLSNFEVLTADLLKPEDKEKILAEVVNIKDPKAPLPSGFTLKWLDTYSRVAVILFRGVEVLLLFKRSTSRLSTLSLEVGPRAYLRHSDEAWFSVRLMEIYPGLSMAERISELENSIKESELYVLQLEHRLEEQRIEKDSMIEELVDRLRKKQPKISAPTAALPVPPPQPMETPDIRAFLAKLKPIKVNKYVRNSFLDWQGCKPADFDKTVPKGYERDTPEGKPNHKFTRLFKKLTRLEKMWRKAKRERTPLEPYQPPAPVVKKKKIKDSKILKSAVGKKLSSKKPLKKVVKKIVRKGKKK